MGAADRPTAGEYLDECIARWNDGDGEGLSLCEYLGMSPEEYAGWVGARPRPAASRPEPIDLSRNLLTHPNPTAPTDPLELLKSMPPMNRAARRQLEKVLRRVPS